MTNNDASKRESASTTINGSSHDPPTESRPNSDAKICEALELGARIDRAAAFAMLDAEVVRQFSGEVVDYQRRLDQARASGYVDLLRRLRESEQIQALKLLVDLCYSEELNNTAEKDKEMKKHDPKKGEWNDVARQMTAEQMDRLPEILELGRRTDAARQTDRADEAPPDSASAESKSSSADTPTPPPSSAPKSDSATSSRKRGQ